MLTLPAESILEASPDGANCGFGEQEAYVSLYRAAQRKAVLGYPVEDIIEAFMRVADVAPTRAEPLHVASKLCRLNSMFEKGCEIARRAIELSAAPAGALFDNSWTYEYGALDEFAVNAYWAGRYDDCLDACLKLLERNTIPADQRGRIVANAQFARLAEEQVVRVIIAARAAAPGNLAPEDPASRGLILRSLQAAGGPQARRRRAVPRRLSRALLAHRERALGGFARGVAGSKSGSG